MLRTVAAAIQSALDIILPRNGRSVRLDAYRPEDLPVTPYEDDACGVRITTLMRYRDRAVEDCIRALKYDRSGHAAALLAAGLAEYLREEIAQRRLFDPRPVILIPIPLHPSRERKRGFNQVMRVLENLPDEFKDGTLARVEPDALIRTRATRQQARLARPERLRNVAGAFALGKALEGADVFLIDDVATTGATLAAAAGPFNTEPTLLALAHA